MFNLVSAVINIDDRKIDRPRYLFVRDSGLILFGIGFNNSKELSEHPKLHKDCGSRDVRSFVAIVIEACEFDNLQSIPVDKDFYINLYLKYITNIWDLPDRLKNHEAIISEISEQEPMGNWCKLDGNLSFNADDALCRFFNPTDESSILSSIKRCHSNIAIGLNVEDHVLTAIQRISTHPHIANALCLNTKKEHDYEFIKNVSSPGKEFQNTTTQKRRGVLDNDKNLMSINWGEKNVTDSSQKGFANWSLENTDESFMGHHGSIQEPVSKNDFSKKTHHNETNEDGIPKKGFRLKPIALGVIMAVVAMIFIIFRCSKNCQTNQHKSISGDTKQAVKTMCNK